MKKGRKSWNGLAVMLWQKVKARGSQWLKQEALGQRKRRQILLGHKWIVVSGEDNMVRG